MYNTSFIHLSMSDKEDLLMIRVERFLVLMATVDIFADLAWLPILVRDDSFNQLIGVIRPWIRVWKPKNLFPWCGYVSVLKTTRVVLGVW